MQPHVLKKQTPEQHAVAVRQGLPFGRQVTHAPFTQLLGAQHVVPPQQIWPVEQQEPLQLVD